MCGTGTGHSWKRHNSRRAPPAPDPAVLLSMVLESLASRGRAVLANPASLGVLPTGMQNQMREEPLRRETWEQGGRVLTARPLSPHAEGQLVLTYPRAIFIAGKIGKSVPLLFRFTVEK